MSESMDKKALRDWVESQIDGQWIEVTGDILPMFAPRLMAALSRHWTCVLYMRDGRVFSGGYFCESIETPSEDGLKAREAAIDAAYKFYSEKAGREHAQRERMLARYAERSPSAASADFDLPAAGDDIGVQCL